MKLHEAANCYVRGAHLHARALRPIQHPRRDLNDLTRSDLDTNDRTAGSRLTAFMSTTTTVIGMPPIMKLYQLPDMGRMTL